LRNKVDIAMSSRKEYRDMASSDFITERASELIYQGKLDEDVLDRIEVLGRVRMSDLKKLSDLIYERNRIGKSISKIIGRPALSSHIGEYIASNIFNIELEESATSKGIDGRFTEGPLKGKTVNIKIYGKREGFLDISLGNLADYYLVLTGPKTTPKSSKGETRPIVISNVYLFNMVKLLKELRKRKLKIGIATSVANQYWKEAEINPVNMNREYSITESQRDQIKLFTRS